MCRLSSRQLPSPRIGVEVDKRSTVWKYKAHIRIRTLRLYTRSQTDAAMAIENHILLAQIRRAMHESARERPEIWECPDTMCDIVRAIIAVNDAMGSEEDIGLSVFVSFRAAKWLGKNVTITSPVLDLHAALVLNSRLLCARQTSWSALRAEWIEVMKHKRHIPSKMRSLMEAEALADEARQRHELHRQKKHWQNEIKAQTRRLARQKEQENRLRERDKRREARAKRQLERKRFQEQRSQAFAQKRHEQHHAALQRLLAKAVSRVERVLACEERKARLAQRKIEAAKTAEWRKILAEAAQARAFALGRLRQVRKLWQEKQRWLRRKDMTTEETLNGLPLHLRGP